MFDIVAIKNEIETQVSNPETMHALLGITFKGLTPELAKRALLEGMMRGLQFQNFLNKDVYAIPFEVTNKNKEKELTYSLITSIDYARKIGMRSGVVGKSAPVYTENAEGGILTCSITVQRKIGEHIGDYSALVYFGEYTTGKNLWTSKPRTMIAKVAEMHALRMACPEELSQAYIEEEHDQEVIKHVELEEKKNNTINEDEAKLKQTTTLIELQLVWQGLQAQSKATLKPLKDELKQKYANS